MQDIKLLFSLANTFTRRFFRNRTAIFFTFVFPIVFLFIFGALFGKNSEPTFKIALINHSKTEFASGFMDGVKNGGVLKIQTVDNFDSAKQKLGRGELDAILELPENFGTQNAKGLPTGTLLSYYDKGNETLAQTFNSVIDSLIESINNRLVPSETPFKVEAKAISTLNLSRFDYTFSGLLGFSLLSLGIFSMTEGFAVDKKNGALRRLRVSPIKTWQMIMATAINRVFVGILVVAAMFIFALTVFDFNMRGDYVSFLLFTILSTFCMFGFGMAIAGWAKDGNQAAPLANLVSFPMMFLSGVFFPRFLMPEWLQGVTNYLPLTPVVDGFRMILTEGKTIFQIGSQLAIIGAWTLIIYIISFKVFRWE